MRGASVLLVVAAFLVSLALFVFGGVALLGRTAEEAAVPTTTAPAEAPATTAPTTTAPAEKAETAQAPTLTIINSGGERVEVEVEIADTDAERERGLMERTELAQDAGMLFVFEEEQQLAFFMRDTLIPLSIAYIDAEGTIVDIQDMQPLDETPVPSAAPAQYALEVNQGFFEARGIQVGDWVELPLL